MRLIILVAWSGLTLAFVAFEYCVMLDCDVLLEEMFLLSCVGEN